MKLSIIIPLFNEQHTILSVLEKLESVDFSSKIKEIEIIIVNDFSSDQSILAVNDYIIGKEHIKLYSHDKNMGKGASVRTGLKYASGDVFLVQDADLELNPDDIPSLINAMFELNVELVNGSRYLSGVNRPLSSYKRYLANKFFTFLTSILIDVKLTDMACGYKLFTRNLYEKIILKENRFGFEAELIIKALKIAKNKVAEVPVRYNPRQVNEGKKLNNLDALKILKTILKYGL